MATFIKRPVTVEAEQFFYDGPPIKGVFYPPVSEDSKTYIGDAYVVTIHEQRCYIQNGDWILPEPDGIHFYPVKPEIFAATYQPVAIS